MNKSLVVLFLFVAYAYGAYLQNGELQSETKRDFGNVNHKVFLKLQGFIDDFPLDVFLEHLNYDDEHCEHGEKTHARITAVVKNKFIGNNTRFFLLILLLIDIYGDLLYYKCYVSVRDSNLLRTWNCLTPIEVNKEYDISEVNCTDSKGEDPFKGYRGVDGVVETIDLTFTTLEDYLLHAGHPFYRESYDGCYTTPELRTALGVLYFIIGALFIIGVILISKCAKKHLAKRKEEQAKDRLLYS